MSAESLDLFLFANDIKLVGKTAILVDCLQAQEELTSIEYWSIDNELTISLQKFQMLHLGKNNIHFKYTIGSFDLVKVEKCADLGIIRSEDFS